ncbi:MAG: hypothetical protein ACKO65_02075 [Betaproteobacteria bacterium]
MRQADFSPQYAAMQNGNPTVLLLMRCSGHVESVMIGRQADALLGRISQINIASAYKAAA